jgi:predicted nucleotidyltransferase component of viral defense system
MDGLRDAQAIELFHLAFLQVLQGRLNQDRYVLKGGANLRYFFESVRYSEDIDLDVSGIERWELEEKVDGVLGSPALAVLLRGGGLAVESFTKPKQTETTQRWKVALALAGREEPLRTKIEFSRRNGDNRHVLEAVPARIVAPYALRSPSLRHYNAEAAVEQKVDALALRSETQARDVFDLELLLRPRPALAAALPADQRERAAERALEVTFADFVDQVRPFLDPEVAELYVDPAVWEQVRSFVVDRLLEAPQ